MKPSVLALDLATTTGWAWHTPGRPRPFFDAFTLPGEPGEVGRPAVALEHWLRRIYAGAEEQGAPITHWFFEAQHIDAKINIDTVYRLIALGGIVEKVAFEKMPKGQKKPFVYKVEIGKWRKHFLGRGGGFKRDQSVPGKHKPYLPGENPKDLAIERCAKYGWHTDIADAAEACGILDYALTLMPDYVRPWRDDLLMKTMER